MVAVPNLPASHSSMPCYARKQIILKRFARVNHARTSDSGSSQPARALRTDPTVFPTGTNAFFTTYLITVRLCVGSLSSVNSHSTTRRLLRSFPDSEGLGDA